MYQYLLTKNDTSDLLKMGGKASNLIRLTALNFNVPPFVIIPYSIVNDLQSADYDSLIKEIESYFSSIGISAEGHRYAVRSSGLNEDGKEASFAGQFLSVLNSTMEDLAQNILRVKSSIDRSNVTTYTQSVNSAGGNHMAIIIQLLINAEVSGVAFGINPLNTTSGEKVINAVYGLGEGLVGGYLDADTFIIDDSGRIDSKIVSKVEQVVASDHQSGTETIPVSLLLKDKPTLHTHQIIAICNALDQLEKEFGSPQDIEFCIVNDELFYLQTRPVTAINVSFELNESERGTKVIWDNSNIVESYPGHTLPLTFSFITKMYEAVYRQLMQILGISQTEIAANQSVLANMLGLIHGRVYYNLLNWYRALALIPGFSLNAAFMEKMMGVKENLPLEQLPKRSKGREILRIFRLIYSLLASLFGLNKMRKKFESEFESVINSYSQIDYESKNAIELWSLYLHYEQTLLKKWKAPMVNDFFVMIFFGVLQKFVVKYDIDPKGTLHNDLLAGTGEILSTEPVKITLDLAGKIKNETSLFSVFNTNEPGPLYQMHTEGKFPYDISKIISDFLFKWGDRTSGELKLETMTYRQRPDMYFKLLKSYLRQDLTSEHHSTYESARRIAEEQVQEKLRNKPIKRLVFQYVLKKTRQLVSGRESMRFARTRGYGVVRSIFSAMGRRFYEAGLLESSHDVFYLKLFEIENEATRQTAEIPLRDLVIKRKSQYEAWKNEDPLPERFVTYGEEGIIDGKLNLTEKETILLSDSDITGTGCSPGVVRGRVRVVLDPNETDDLIGDILVTSYTDPGWVTLFPTISAIIVEKGSLLSHSAIVSRELGIPCIVGVRNATKLLKSGMEIEMDGRLGIIKILNHEPS